MLLLIILLVQYSSSFRVPPILRPNIVAGAIPEGGIAGAIPEGAVAGAIPEGGVDNFVPLLDQLPNEIRNTEILSLVGFDDAISLKDGFRWTEDVLVRHYSKVEPTKVRDYIFGQNPAISEATRLRLLEIFWRENFEFLLTDLSPREIRLITESGHARMVFAILDSFLNMGHDAKAYGLAYGAVSGSERGQFGIFRMVFDMLSERVGVNNMPKLLQRAMETGSPLEYAEYGLNKIRDGLRRPGAPAMPEDWYDILLEHFIKSFPYDGGQRLVTFKFLLRQPEWNPGTISNLLDTVVECFQNRKMRFTRELLQELRNPRRTFLDSDGNQINGGIGALRSAILEAQEDPFLNGVEFLLGEEWRVYF